MVLWWDIKTFNIEYYDIQYAAERTINLGLPVCIFLSQITRNKKQRKIKKKIVEITGLYDKSL